MKNIDRLQKDLWNTILLAVICLYLVATWLPDSQILGGWDVGIPVLFPQKELGIVSSTWWDTHSTGFMSPQTLTNVPFYAVLSIFEKFGFSVHALQQIFLGGILFGGSLSIYFLSKILDLNRFASLVASLFYIFNLTSLMVWQRGVHNAMLVLLLAPLSLLIIAYGVIHRKYSSLILLNISCFFLSYVYGGTGYIFSLWLLWSIFLLTQLVGNWRKIEVRKFVIYYSILLFVSWVLTNTWWMVTFLESSKYVIEQFSVDEIRQRTSDVVIALQAQTDPAYILRGLSRFYHYDISDWGSIYKHPVFLVLSWLPVILIFSTILDKRNYKLVIWQFGIVLSLTILLIAKGVNSPLGELNKIIYDLLPQLAPLRNPYEKVGILLCIPYALLFGLSIDRLKSLNVAENKSIGWVFAVGALVCCLGFLVWPLWSGSLFVSQGSSFKIDLPEYYSQANQWIETQDGDGRILQLPISPGESIDYSWGYSGIEPSQYLFNKPSVGYLTGIPQVDQKTESLIKAIHKQDNPTILKMLQSMNIQWIVVHNESVWRQRGLEPVERINDWLKLKPNYLEYQARFGQLEIWKVKNEFSSKHFSVSSELVSFDKDTLEVNQFWNLLSEDSAYVMLKHLNSETDIKLSDYMNRRVLVPEIIDKLDNSANVNIENALKELPYVKHLPDSPLYPLVRLKEKFSQVVDRSNPTGMCLTFAGKRLVESVRLSQKGSIDLSEEYLEEYDRYMQRCATPLKASLMSQAKDTAWKQELINILNRQLLVLANSFSDENLISLAIAKYDQLNSMMEANDLSQIYTPQYLDDQHKLVIYKLNVNYPAKFSVKFYNPSPSLTKTNPVINQIDERQTNIMPIVSNAEIIEFPEVWLDKGFHTIHLQIDDPPDNVDFHPLKLDNNVSQSHIDGKTIYQLNAINSPALLSFRLNDINIEQVYIITFEYLVEKGSYPHFSLVQNSDPINQRGEVQSRMFDVIRPDNYDFRWRTQGYNYQPTMNALDGTFNIIAPLWNNCNLTLSREECTKSEIVRIFNRPSTINVRNIHVERRFQDRLVLESRNNEVALFDDTKVSSQKLSATNYRINLKMQKTPFVFVFSETYHPAWKLVDGSGQEISALHFIVNGYANGWVINQILPDQIYVKFMLQKNVPVGITLAGISAISFFILVLVLDKRNDKKN